MASASGTRTTALLFSFSAILFLLFLLLLQAPAPRPGLAVADLLASAVDRLLDGRGVLELATRRNMILLCHAILLIILRDAGVLGAPARRRSRSVSGCPPAEATAAVAGTDIIACSAAPAPARPNATRSAVVVWRRRPRNRAAALSPMHEHDAAGRVVVECWPAVEAVATWAAPPQAEEAAAVASKQIVVVESPRHDDDDDLLHRHVRAGVLVEPLEHPTTAIAADGEREDCDDRRIIAVANDDTAREQQTAGMEMEMEMELADDRRFEEFIKSQMRQEESLQLVISSGDHHYQYQAIATCY